MNRITVVNDIITEQVLSDQIQLESTEKNTLFQVNHMTIKIKQSCSLEMIYETTKETKLDITIVVYEGVHVNIFEKRIGEKTKVQYNYTLDTNAKVEVTKFYVADQLRELSLIHLNGENASIDYHLKTIASERQKYDVVVYHNHKNTISNVYHHGVNVGSKSFIFNVTGVIPKGNTGCILNQQSRILTNTLSVCKICPNLLIDENDVEANHAAHIGTFTEEEFFYLMSRGIPKKDAMILLTEGFLLGGLPIHERQQEMLKKEVEKVWR